MLFKSKKLEITFNTVHNQLIDLFPPVRLNKVIPSWFKDLNNSNIPTLRNCPGVTELFKDGIGIPMWRDISISYSGNKIDAINIPGVHRDATHEFVVMHPDQQWSGAYPNHIHIKLINPWLINTNRFAKFLMTDPCWHKNSPQSYTVPTGMIEFKYQHSAHVNIFLPITNSKKTVEFKAGEIIAYLFPTFSEDLDIKYRKINREEFFDLLPYTWTFNKLYARTKKILQDKTK